MVNVFAEAQIDCFVVLLLHISLFFCFCSVDSSAGVRLLSDRLSKLPSPSSSLAAVSLSQSASLCAPLASLLQHPDCRSFSAAGPRAFCLLALEHEQLRLFHQHLLAASLGQAALPDPTDRSPRSQRALQAAARAARAAHSPGGQHPCRVVCLCVLFFSLK
jgi:hypothetical protein